MDDSMYMDANKVKASIKSMFKRVDSSGLNFEDYVHKHIKHDKELQDIYCELISIYPRTDIECATAIIMACLSNVYDREMSIAECFNNIAYPSKELLKDVKKLRKEFEKKK